jgi:hypothetical protein
LRSCFAASFAIWTLQIIETDGTPDRCTRQGCAVALYQNTAEQFRRDSAQLRAPVVSAKAHVTSISERLDRVGGARDEAHGTSVLGPDWLHRRREVYMAYLLAENAVYKEHFATRGLPPERRAASATRGQRQGGGKSRACPYRHGRHAGHHPALVPTTRCQEIRGQPAATSARRGGRAPASTSPG